MVNLIREQPGRKWGG